MNLEKRIKKVVHVDKGPYTLEQPRPDVSFTQPRVYTPDFEFAQGAISKKNNSRGKSPPKNRKSEG